MFQTFWVSIRGVYGTLLHYTTLYASITLVQRTLTRINDKVKLNYTN